MPGLLDEPYPQGYGTGLLGYGNPVVYRGAIIPRVETADGTTGWGWPQMALDAYQAMKAPGDVWQGKLDPRSQEGQERAMNLAGLLTLGSGAIPKPAGAFAMGTSNVGKVPQSPRSLGNAEAGSAPGAIERRGLLYNSGMSADGKPTAQGPIPSGAVENLDNPLSASERLAQIARERLGPEWNVSLSHSRNQVGDSSYIKVNRAGERGSVGFEGRVSDHGLGPMRYGNYQWHGLAGLGSALSPDDLAGFINRIDRLPAAFQKADITKSEYLSRAIERAEAELRMEGPSWGSRRRYESKKRIAALKSELDEIK